MKPDDYFLPFAKNAYETYHKGGDEYYVKWKYLIYEEKVRWVGVVKGVFRDLDVRDVDTQERYEK